MTQGKNPRKFKSHKGGARKKVHHPFAKKEWYNVLAPSVFDKRVFTLTPCNKTAGQKIASDSLRGRVFESSLADLKDSAPDLAYRKIRLQVEEVKDYDCYTSFYGMDITRDKLCQLIKKWHSLIEAQIDVKSQDGYMLRLFAIGFTSKDRNEMKATCYANANQTKQIRKKMMEIIAAEVTKNPVKDLVKKFIGDHFTKEITKACKPIFPLQNVLIRKVKVLKKPKFDVTKLMELYSESRKPAAEKKSAKDEEGQGESKNALK